MQRLDQPRIVDAAMQLADAEGLGPLTIRRLAQELGVGAMSIYHYVPHKDALLDEMVDRVFAEVAPPGDGPWRAALRQRCVDLREALRAHPWAVGLMDSRRNPGPASLHHHEAVLACVRGAGFTIPAAAHTFALLDAYVYGFAVQAASLPFSEPAELAEITDDIFTAEVAAAHPHMVEFAQNHALQPGYDFEDEFAVGLDLLLDAIARDWAPPQSPTTAGRPPVSRSNSS
jgi:AcrR family transcriptional regulator